MPRSVIAAGDSSVPLLTDSVGVGRQPDSDDKSVSDGYSEGSAEGLWEHDAGTPSPAWDLGRVLQGGKTSGTVSSEILKKDPVRKEPSFLLFQRLATSSPAAQQQRRHNVHLARLEVDFQEISGSHSHTACQ